MEFYSVLGFSFEKHAHGSGPEHYAAEGDGIVFELYPLAKDDGSTRNTRIGFQVDDAAAMIERLGQFETKMISPLKDSPWGLRAVIDDPFGHRIEITQKPA